MPNKKKLAFANHNHPHSEEERNDIIEKAAKAYEAYMDALGYDWRNDPNSSNTPHRVAKAFVNDFAWGCYSEPPKITAFDNVDKYDGIVAQNNIKVTSLCSHHHAPFMGFAHVAYIPSKNGKVIGLSKLNRIVDWFSRRPQVQENLTMQIHDYINEVCEKNNGVAVMVEANHTCCSNRGIRHDSTMRTARMSGAFLDNNDNSRSEFYKFIEFAQNRNLI
jgi:GTP cyclohydrolase I